MIMSLRALSHDYQTDWTNVHKILNKILKKQQRQEMKQEVIEVHNTSPG